MRVERLGRRPGPFVTAPSRNLGSMTRIGGGRDS
jgi:hypothetical protein